jgi:hypothetical protein
MQSSRDQWKKISRKRNIRGCGDAQRKNIAGEAVTIGRISSKGHTTKYGREQNKHKCCIISKIPERIAYYHIIKHKLFVSQSKSR